MSQEEEFIDVNQALTLRESMDGWYCIEKKEHENEMGFRPFGPPGLGGMALYSSARPSDADVEGTAEEMLDIAQAIDERGSFSAKRCAVRHATACLMPGSPSTTHATSASRSRRNCHELIQGDLQHQGRHRLRLR
jgi:hypothetical protein